MSTEESSQDGSQQHGRSKKTRRRLTALLTQDTVAKEMMLWHPAHGLAARQATQEGLTTRLK